MAYEKKHPVVTPYVRIVTKNHQYSLMIRVILVGNENPLKFLITREICFSKVKQTFQQSM